MSNTDLMQILKEINLSNQYKKLSISLGVLALAGIFTCIHYHLKFKCTKNDLAELNSRHKWLLKDNWADKELIKKQQKVIEDFLPKQ